MTPPSIVSGPSALIAVARSERRRVRAAAASVTNWLSIHPPVVVVGQSPRARRGLGGYGRRPALEGEAEEPPRGGGRIGAGAHGEGRLGGRRGARVSDRLLSEAFVLG